jgi:valine dehydrogenase (NAD+)
VTVTDVNASAVAAVRQELPSVQAVTTTDELVRADLDVYAPCALGGAVDDAVAAALTARIVCGAANNQLAHAGVEKDLADRGITYAPDYCVNAGGLIQVADELEGFSFERARAKAELIFDTTAAVLRQAAAASVPPSMAADRIAEQRMSDLGRLRDTWLPGRR